MNDIMEDIMKKYNVKYLGELPDGSHYLIDYITDDETMKNDFCKHFDCRRINYIEKSDPKPKQLILHRYNDEDWEKRFFEPFTGTITLSN